MISDDVLILIFPTSVNTRLRKKKLKNIDILILYNPKPYTKFLIGRISFIIKPTRTIAKILLFNQKLYKVKSLIDNFMTKSYIENRSLRQIYSFIFII